MVGVLEPASSMVVSVAVAMVVVVMGYLGLFERERERESLIWGHARVPCFDDTFFLRN